MGSRNRLTSTRERARRVVSCGGDCKGCARVTERWRALSLRGRPLSRPTQRADRRAAREHCGQVWAPLDTPPHRSARDPRDVGGREAASQRRHHGVQQQVVLSGCHGWREGGHTGTFMPRYRPRGGARPLRFRATALGDPFRSSESWSPSQVSRWEGRPPKRTGGWWWPSCPNPCPEETFVSRTWGLTA
jgi:hypothetical protein